MDDAGRMSAASPPDTTSDTDLPRSIPPLPDQRVIENKHSTGIGACLTLRVNAHTGAQTQIVDSTSVECLF